MSTLSAAEARKKFSRTLSRAALGHERIVLTRHGEQVAAIVSIDDLRLLEELEDKGPAELATRRGADPKARRRIPYEKVRKELGL